MVLCREARCVLEEAAAELNPTSQWPVDVLEVLYRLGIQWRYQQSDRPGVAYLTLGSQSTITLNGPAPGSRQMTRRDRFSVAHELGHWILWRDLQIPPATDVAEYWRQEELCNRFAAELLLPARAFRCFISEASVPVVEYPRLVADAANVTWHVAARALSEHACTDLAYLRLKSVSPTGRLQVECSSLSAKPGAYAAQGAMMFHGNPEILFLAMRQVAMAGSRSTFWLRLSLALGSLRLDNVPCAVLSAADHWIVCFKKSLPGVTVSGRTLKPAVPGTQHLVSDELAFGGDSSKELLRAVQILAIKDAARRLGLSDFDMAVLLGRSYGKLSLAHLTKAEADAFLRQLRSPNGTCKVNPDLATL